MDGRRLVGRDQWGRYQPGTSGNPAGRPPIPSAIRRAAAVHSLDAIDLLATVMRDRDQTLSARFLAAKELLKISGHNLPDEMDLSAVSDEVLDRLLEDEKVAERAAMKLELLAEITTVLPSGEP